MKKIIIILLIVIVALACAFGLYFVLKDDKNPYVNYDEPLIQSQSVEVDANNEEEITTTTVEETSSNDPELDFVQEKVEVVKKEAKEEPKKLGKKEEVKNVFKKSLDKKGLIKEYQEKGKDATYVASLSDHYLHVYFENGLVPTKYRKNLLKDLLVNIKKEARDYNLTIFVKMLPNLSMDLSIYNKDIIFANRKKYQYTYKEKPISFKLDFKNNNYKNFKGEKELLAYTNSFKRPQILKQVHIQSYNDKKGSKFANYILGLQRAVRVAAYFFPLSEAIYIHSYGNAKKRLKNHVEIFYNN